MELTISQINSASPSWSARARPAATGDARPQTSTSAGAGVGPVEAAVQEISGAETEYDQFGRFGVTQPEETAVAEDSDSKSPTAINVNKNFRSGKVTVSELEQEYVRTLIGGAQAERRFIPAGMTEYQVSSLTDYQYRWAIDAERRALVSAPASSIATPSGSDTDHTDEIR